MAYTEVGNTLYNWHVSSRPILIDLSKGWTRYLGHLSTVRRRYVTAYRGRYIEPRMSDPHPNSSEEAYLRDHGSEIEDGISHALRKAIAARAHLPLRFIAEQLLRDSDAPSSGDTLIPPCSHPLLPPYSLTPLTPLTPLFSCRPPPSPFRGGTPATERP